ncbi:membrane ATPase/protein kinase [Desulfamplus magnetovallimortis]|uniref:Membrane ATPase/protein kinase n=1 Tax=Desulfamplus magnetovallimortis TaxID=1246637 RepID=A0A1W1HFV3_9BACT|nr:methylmalonyl Co-A mutase-associated GTPase MeaB [Desulfamplus magnetovallimortis]SLM31303.1 membrane ATPase/protein kinase [Desulfamplus magnetovallimortis]
MGLYQKQDADEVIIVSHKIQKDTDCVISEHHGTQQGSGGVIAGNHEVQQDADVVITGNHKVQQYVEGVLAGNRRIIAKTMTLVESLLPLHRRMAGDVLDMLLPHTGKAVRLGITGVPGVGKSTFVESLGLSLADKGHRVAVLAVDPSSRRSGGSILGDKTRMEKLSSHPGAFIRPSPSGETLGGVAARTREMMLVCEAAGYDVILVETVGVGQSEITVATMVDFFLALMIAGAGDELQGIKKGILEVADAIAINKADGDNLKRADIARQEYEIAMHMVTPESPTWRPPVLTCSSVVAGGTDKVWETVLEHRNKMKASGEFEQRRKKQAIDWMWHLIDEGLKASFKENQQVIAHLPEMTHDVREQRLSPTSAAEKLLSYFLSL